MWLPGCKLHLICVLNWAATWTLTNMNCFQFVVYSEWLKTDQTQFVSTARHCCDLGQKMLQEKNGVKLEKRHNSRGRNGARADRLTSVSPCNICILASSSLLASSPTFTAAFPSAAVMLLSSVRVKWPGRNNQHEEPKPKETCFNLCKFKCEGNFWLNKKNIHLVKMFYFKVSKSFV